ncbi:MAG: RHS repeat protein [Planctomycetes bacterium]|nr:RHS repeat protein [Planctomycetota bacterium]
MKTIWTHDDQGRQLTMTPPDGMTQRWYYSQLGDERPVTLHYPKYTTDPLFYGPADGAVTNHAGKTEASFLVAVSGGSTGSAQANHVDETDDDPITAMDLGTVSRLVVNLYSEEGTQLESSWRYFDVPTSGAGTEGTHYDETLYGYDDSGRPTRVKEPSGTITRTEYDLHGHVIERHVGTNDSLFDGGEPSGTDNMVKTEELVYDDIDDNGVGDPGGNGLLSLRTLFVQDGTSGQRETKFTYDLKGNLLLQKNPVSPHAFLKVDNLGRTVAAGLFSSTDDIVVGTDDPVQEADNRVGLMQRFFDERGDLWKAQVHKIDPSSGSNLDNLVTEYWRDADGRLTKTDGSQLAKTRYDTLGRVTHEFTLATTNDTGYADADDVTGDVVLEERQAAFDPTTGRLFMTATIERNHDDASTTGALDANGDGDWLKYTMDSSNVKGRIQIVGLWYDADRGRLQDRVEVGTNEGNLFNRGAMSNPPNRSISRLRYTYAYNEDGTLGTVIDSDSHVALYEHDDAGRLTKEARNYDANVNGGAPSGTDDNVTVTYAYLDGLLRSRTADVPGSNDQETLYIYGTTEGTPAASKVSTGHLLRAIKYADSTNPAEDADDIDGVGGSDSDIVSFAYNAQGEGVYRKDQAGNVLQVDLDGAGRPAAVKATAIAEDFDSSVQRIDWAYDDMGRIRTLTQYDSTSGQTAVDQERFSYDGWGLPALVEYDRDGLVGEQGSVNDYDIAYLNEKATDGRNALRRTEMTLPSGRDITYAYSTANYDEDASRVTQVKMDETVLAAYDYIGASRVAETTYDEIDIYSSAWAGTSGEYDGWDELTRPKKNRWTKELGQNDVHVFFTDVSMSSCCGAGTSEDTVLDHHDVKYENDGLGRRTLEHEGTLVDGAMTNTSRKHEATLDHLANWVAAKLDKNGDGDCLDLDIGEYDDDRAFNLANELTGIDRDDDSAFDDVVPAFDPNGNMTDDGEWHEYVYDAFNRLVQIKNTATQALEVELKYSGRGLLVGRHGDVDGGTVTENDPWYHLVYDAEGQQAATFRASDTSPKEEFVPHDAGLGGFGGGWNDRRIILRDRDGGNDDWTSQASGQFSERIYYCQDPQKNVVALIDGDGKMVEWVKYSVPFGLPWGDVDSDGDRDGDDADAADAIFDASGYDVRADTNLDGQVTAADVGAIAGSPEVHLGYGKISDCMSLRATAGLPLLLVDGAVYLGPAGALSLDLGRLNCRAADRECGFSRYRLGLVLSCFTYPPPDDVPAMTWHDITEPYRDVLEKLLEVLQSYMDARRDQMLTNPPTCTVSVYCGGIPFLEMVGIVHCWVTVKHCDGGNQRYEKWQWDNPDMAPEGKQLGSKDSNVFMNRTGESDDAMSDGVGGDVELVHKEDFDCIANEKENTWEDPPACQKLTPDVVGTYSAADWYFLFGPNSNTFAQSLIYFVGIDYQLPAGAVGRGNFGTFNFDG